MGREIGQRNAERYGRFSGKVNKSFRKIVFAYIYETFMILFCISEVINDGALTCFDAQAVPLIRCLRNFETMGNYKTISVAVSNQYLLSFKQNLRR